jgi:hypothetical protein
MPVKGHVPNWRHLTLATNAGRVLRGRFTGLTLILVALSLLATLLPPGELREILVDTTFSILLFFAVRSVSRPLRLATMILAVPLFVGLWTLHYPASPIHRTTVFALTTSFLAYLTFVILIDVLRDEAVTGDTIVGAVCVYFLLGVGWGNAYALVEMISPGSFVVSPALAAAGSWSVPTKPVTPLLQYYSFTTLATLGLGDITPLSAPARALTALEGLSGQLYLAVLIARLVGIHSARPRRE